MIEAEDLTVHAGGRALLAAVSVRVRPGRVLVVLGPNGAGKSTLLRALCGDVAPVSGSIRLGGRPLSQWSRREQARRRAVMLQESSLSFPFAVLDVVLMGRAPHVEGVERQRDRVIARAALERVQANGLEARLYPTLSGGEKQRVQMARALAQVWEPIDGGGRCLMLDEPTASLDPRHQHVALGHVRRFAADGGAALVVLHDLNLAARYADDLVLLDRGAVVASGPASTTLTEANLQRTFSLPIRILAAPELQFPLVYNGGSDHDAGHPEPH